MDKSVKKNTPRRLAHMKHRGTAALGGITLLTFIAGAVIVLNRPVALPLVWTVIGVWGIMTFFCALFFVIQQKQYEAVKNEYKKEFKASKKAEKTEAQKSESANA